MIARQMSIETTNLLRELLSSNLGTFRNGQPAIWNAVTQPDLVGCTGIACIIQPVPVGAILGDVHKKHIRVQLINFNRKSSLLDAINAIESSDAVELAMQTQHQPQTDDRLEQAFLFIQTNFFQPRT